MVEYLGKAVKAQQLASVAPVCSSGHNAPKKNRAIGFATHKKDCLRKQISIWAIACFYVFSLSNTELAYWLFFLAKRTSSVRMREHFGMHVPTKCCNTI